MSMIDIFNDTPYTHVMNMYIFLLYEYRRSRSYRFCKYSPFLALNNKYTRINGREARINDSIEPRRECNASSRPRYRVIPAGIRPRRINL
jgi:hypothetical protein